MDAPAPVVTRTPPAVVSNPIAGDPGKTVVSLKRVGSDTIEETDKRGGKVTDIIRSTVSADGKTLHVVDNDVVHETRIEYIADKQP